MARYLGVDYGQKRIGLAISDPTGRIASPIRVVPARGQPRRDARAVLQVIGEYDVEAIVVGLPLNMDDTEGPQAKQSRAFGKAIGELTGLPVHYWDERLSTFAADALIDQAGISPRKRRRRRDAVAAQLILQGFLDARNRPGQ